MRRTALAALCVAAAATVTLTGCLPGGDEAGKGAPFAGLSGGEIAERAMKATKGAASLRLKGDVPDQASGGSIRIDMALDTKGDCAGSLGMNGDGEIELIKTGDTVYMKYDEALVRSQGEGQSKAEVDMAVQMLAGKWVKADASGAEGKELTGFCDLGTLLAEFDDSGTNAERGDITEIGGVPAIALDEKDGKGDATAYVATEGEPYFLRLVSKDPEVPGDLTFSDYDEPVPSEAPKGEVLDLDELGA
ncbi:hypothetical protein [Streptomyces sp. CRN 30]|uniref:hypothetical protein n=1 Tax=Streptomyces sp. CRN 30 TaxID=3075613 RepID=UPI002A808EF3|nr:hypothetical protein [Streptomyces sp. CRN 30]